MIPEETEERLMQAVTIIEELLTKPTPDIINIAQAFVKENKEDE